MAGGGACGARIEETMNRMTDKGTSFMRACPGLLVHVWALDNAPALCNHRKQTRSVLVHPHVQKTSTKKFNLCWS